jgi:hypothetical protein
LLTAFSFLRQICAGIFSFILVPSTKVNSTITGINSPSIEATEIIENDVTDVIIRDINE